MLFRSTTNAYLDSVTSTSDNKELQQRTVTGEPAGLETRHVRRASVGYSAAVAAGAQGGLRRDTSRAPGMFSFVFILFYTTNDYLDCVTSTSVNHDEELQ